MKYKEISSWAKGNNCHLFKEDDTIKWHCGGTIMGSGDVSQVALQVWNYITDYKWVPYQEQYRQDKMSNIHFDI